MPNEELDVETDGNQKTAYEDLHAHERTGFVVREPENFESQQDASQEERS